MIMISKFEVLSSSYGKFGFGTSNCQGSRTIRPVSMAILERRESPERAATSGSPGQVSVGSGVPWSYVSHDFLTSREHMSLPGCR